MTRTIQCGDCGETFLYNGSAGSRKLCDWCREERKRKLREKTFDVMCIRCKTKFRSSSKAAAGRNNQHRFPSTLNGKIYSKVLCERCFVNERLRRHVISVGEYVFWAKQTIHTHQRRGKPIGMSAEDLADLAKNTPNCQICGKPLMYFGRTFSPRSSHAKYNHELSATLDRIQNNIESGPRDVGILCRRCNSLKGDICFDDLKQMTRGLVNYIRKVEPDFSTP